MKKIISVGVYAGFLMAAGIGGTPAVEADTSIKTIGEIQETYDDNILYEPDNELDDFITTALAGIKLQNEGKTHFFDITGSIEQNIFVNHDSFNNTAEYLDMEFDKTLSELQSVQLTNNFEHAEVPDTFEESFGRETGRYEFYSNDFGIEYEQKIDAQYSFDVAYGNELYHARREDIRDSVNHLAALGWNYRADPLNTYSMNYEFDYAMYDDDRDAHTHKVFGSWSRYFDKRTELAGDLGASVINSFGNEDLIRPYARVKFTNELREDTQIALTLKKEYRPSRFRSDVLDLWQASADLYQQFNERFDGKIGVFYGMGEYMNSGIEDELAGVDMNLGYYFKENIKLFMSYLFALNDSNDESRNYDKNRVSMGIRINF